MHSKVVNTLAPDSHNGTRPSFQQGFVPLLAGAKMEVTPTPSKCRFRLALPVVCVCVWVARVATSIFAFYAGMEYRIAGSKIPVLARHQRCKWTSLRRLFCIHERWSWWIVITTPCDVATSFIATIRKSHAKQACINE